MTFFFVILAIFIALLMVMPLYRVVVGPTVYDRVIGAALIGTKSIILLAIIGFTYHRI